MDAPLVIQTRQKADPLFVSTSKPLEVGVSLPSPIFETDGYAQIGILLISDKPFRIRIEEANQVSGPFAQTRLIAGTLDAATGLQKVSTRISPNGSFMRAFLDNLGALETILQVSILGLPLARL